MLTHRQRCICEPIERRLLLVTFVVTGTAGPDSIDLVVSGGEVIATVNGSPTSMSDALVTAVQINALGGNDTVTIRSNGDNPLHYDGGDGNDIVTIGDPASGMQSILADITLTNPAGFNELIFDDSAGGIGRSVIFDVTSIAGADHGRISGLATGTMLYKLADTSSPVLVNGGGGADTFDFRATMTRPIVANGGDGDDVFNFGSTANLVSPLRAQVTVNGNGGNDSIVFNDQNEAEPFGFTVTPTTVARFDMASVTYGSVESITINAGNIGGIGGVHTVNGTAADTLLRLNPGPGFDIININETHPSAPVTIGPSLGEDAINVNDDGGSGLAAVIFDATQRIGALSIRNGGHATLTPGGNKVLSVTSLSAADSGVLDLSDNNMILDYSGASPLAAIQSLLISGFAGGAWSGAGIKSSAAAATPGRALGYAEATDLFSSFPAIFAGQMVDDTSILIKHTFYGDADLSGNVNLADFNRLAANFGHTPRRWSQGDFDFNQSVNLADFNRLAGNFGNSGLGPSVGTDERGDDGEAETLPSLESVIAGADETAQRA